jgi:hypothetical protein
MGTPDINARWWVWVCYKLNQLYGLAGLVVMLLCMGERFVISLVYILDWRRCDVWGLHSETLGFHLRGRYWFEDAIVCRSSKTSKCEPLFCGVRRGSGALRLQRLWVIYMQWRRSPLMTPMIMEPSTWPARVRGHWITRICFHYCGRVDRVIVFFVGSESKSMSALIIFVDTYSGLLSRVA